MMRVLLAPSERAASTNSFSRSESVVERTMRAMYGHVKAEMTKIDEPRPGLDEPAQAACGGRAAGGRDADREQQLPAARARRR